MKFKKTILSGALALGLAAPQAAAQDAGTAPDAATMAAAKTAAGAVLPEGIYAKMMEGTFQQLVKQAVTSTMDLPMRDLAQAGGMPEDAMPQMTDATMREVMAIIDPHFEERMHLSIGAMMDGMIPIMTEMEPAMREGLAEAYAGRFNADELAQLNAFFQTPTGSKFAASNFTIFMDPALMSRMQQLTPALMKEMPSLLEDMRAATADLPPPRTIDDLTDEEREKLAEITGGDLPEN